MAHYLTGYNRAMQSAWKVGLMVVLFGVLLLASYAVLQRSMFAEETVE